jgi:hypothetical protein
MKTISEATTSLIEFLTSSPLMLDAQKPTGIISTDRLDNSVLEDVIIEALPLNIKQIQEGVININIFVKNLEFDLPGGGKDFSQRDRVRLAYLERLVYDSFGVDENDAVYKYNYNFSLQQTQIYEDSNNFHYLNIRVQFIAINIQ